MRPLFHGSLTPLLQSVHNPPFKLRSYLAIGSRYLLHFSRNGRMPSVVNCIRNCHEQ